RRSSATTIRNMNHVSPSHHLEQFASNMWCRPNARRSEADLARVGLGISNEFGNRRRRERWIDRDNVGCESDARDWRNVLDEIEIKFFKQARVDRMGGCGLKEGVAVRDGSNDGFGRDIGPSPWPVLDDEWLTEPLRQPLSH